MQCPSTTWHQTSPPVHVEGGGVTSVVNSSTVRLTKLSAMERMRDRVSHSLNFNSACNGQHNHGFLTHVDSMGIRGLDGNTYVDSMDSPDYA